MPAAHGAHGGEETRASPLFQDLLWVQLPRTGLRGSVLLFSLLPAPRVCTSCASEPEATPQFHKLGSKCTKEEGPPPDECLLDKWMERAPNLPPEKGQDVRSPQNTSSDAAMGTGTRPPSSVNAFTSFHFPLSLSRLKGH